MSEPKLSVADNASEVSYKNFSQQDWDNNQRNALRHSMWVGGMARAMGAHPDRPVITRAATAAAKGVGYANEAITYVNKMIAGKTDDPAYVSDTLHDLNANAVGADAAANSRSYEEFQGRLVKAAKNARFGKPVGLLEPTDGRLSADPTSP